MAGPYYTCNRSAPPALTLLFTQPWANCHYSYNSLQSLGLGGGEGGVETVFRILYSPAQRILSFISTC
ncbi:hypothetical protein SUGI_0458780 [Cryptomeria japonica]|nr:hypothetical protein SUGI_0458780 [Cryptomeria japonica]